MTHVTPSLDADATGRMDSSATDDYNESIAFLKVCNADATINLVLGQGYKLQQDHWGDYCPSKVKMSKISDQEELMMLKERYGVKPHNKTYDLRTDTCVFKNAEMATTVTGKAALAMQKISEVVQSIIRDPQGYPNTHREIDLEQAIKREWNRRDANTVHDIGPITCETAINRSRIDIIIYIQDYELEGEESGKAKKTISYVVMTELKVVRTKKEPKENNIVCNEICSQITSYVSEAVEKKICPVAMMLIYTIPRIVTKRNGIHDTTEPDHSNKQVHSFWWPTKRALYRVYPNDQHKWGHGIDQTSTNLLTDQIVAQNTETQDNTDPDDVPAEVEPSTRTRRVKNRSDPGVPEHNTDPDDVPAEVEPPTRTRRVKNRSDPSVPEHIEPARKKRKDASAAIPETSYKEKVMTLADLAQSKFRDPAFYVENHPMTGGPFHSMNPTTLVGEFHELRKWLYVPDAEWLLLEEDIPRPSINDGGPTFLIDRISKTISFKFNFIAIQVRDEDTVDERTGATCTGNKPREGRWIAGRVMNTLVDAECTRIQILMPGWSKTRGGSATLELMHTNGASSNQELDVFHANDGIFTARVQVHFTSKTPTINSRNIVFGCMADFCIFRNEAFHLPDDQNELELYRRMPDASDNSADVSTGTTELRAQCLALEKENNRLQENVRTLETNNSDLQTEKTRGRQDRTQSKEHLENENTKLKENATALENENKTLQKNVRTLETNNSDLQTEKTRVRQDRTQSKEHLENENTKLKENATALENENKTLQENARQTEKTRVRQDRTQSKEHLENENTKLKENATALENENTTLQENARTLETKNGDLQDQGAGLETENSRLEIEIRRLQEPRPANGELQNAIAGLKAMKEDNDRLKLAHKTASLKANLFENKVKRMQNSMKNSPSGSTGTGDHDHMIGTDRHTTDEVDENHEHLTGQIKDLTDQIHELKEANKHLECSLAAQNTRCENHEKLERQTKHLPAKIQHLTDQLEQLKETNKNLESSLQPDQIQHLKDQLHELKETNKKLESSLHAQNTRCENHENLEHSTEQLTDQLKQLKETNKNLECSLVAQNKQGDQLSTHIQNIENTLRDTKLQLDGSEHELDYLHQQLRGTTAEIKRLEDKSEMGKHEMATYEAQILEEKQASDRQAKANIAAVQTKNAKLEEERRNLLKRVKNIQEERAAEKEHELEEYTTVIEQMNALKFSAQEVQEHALARQQVRFMKVLDEEEAKHKRETDNALQTASVETATAVRTVNKAKTDEIRELTSEAAKHQKQQETHTTNKFAQQLEEEIQSTEHRLNEKLRETLRETLENSEKETVAAIEIVKEECSWKIQNAADLAEEVAVDLATKTMQDKQTALRRAKREKDNAVQVVENRKEWQCSRAEDELRDDLTNVRRSLHDLQKLHDACPPVERKRRVRPSYEDEVSEASIGASRAPGKWVLDESDRTRGTWKSGESGKRGFYKDGGASAKQAHAAKSEKDELDGDGTTDGGYESDETPGGAANELTGEVVQPDDHRTVGCKHGQDLSGNDSPSPSDRQHRPPVLCRPDSVSPVLCHKSPNRNHARPASRIPSGVHHVQPVSGNTQVYVSPPDSPVSDTQPYVDPIEGHPQPYVDPIEGHAQPVDGITPTVDGPITMNVEPRDGRCRSFQGDGGATRRVFDEEQQDDRDGRCRSFQGDRSVTKRGGPQHVRPNDGATRRAFGEEQQDGQRGSLQGDRSATERGGPQNVRPNDGATQMGGAGAKQKRIRRRPSPTPLDPTDPFDPGNDTAGDDRHRTPNTLRQHRNAKET